ncbi:CPBP family intramembrane metalloprotease [Iamia sp. SCSIO 61187]|uniref:CPBP family intramembrane glutamic endopeptidase n=1 Tax=Iamia sp. SCSIO 61187 TaxID=2722752 RepID=UPI001C639442|nr:CPBP family intramembrane glutamic endopeptidase [Iamia sp. SCSIO 61187]QYG93948.1 CPBP family intramembrane metalloprotease [Iamia sp. SCSIO 61187]
MGEVAVAALATLVISAVLGSIALGLAGVEDTDDASLVVIALVQTTLWVGMLGSIAVVLRRRGAGLGELGLRARWVDVPVGIVLGVVGQLVLVPLVSWPWTRLLGESSEELREPACRLADKADDPLGVALLFAITVVGAPIVEELFFRGFVQRAAVAAFTRNAPLDDEAAARTAVRLGTGFGLVVTALLFGLVHFQVLQAPALVAFGLVLGTLAHRSGRLGASVVTHMAFNATTVITLVVLSSNDDQCRDVLGVLGGLAG